MGKKITGWKTKGMNQDLSVSAFNPEFSYENRNLRLSTNDGNTMLSWVNEKGTKEIKIRVTYGEWIDDTDLKRDCLVGIPIGTAVVGDYLVVFTVDTWNTIYRIYYNADNDVLDAVVLYRGDLRLSIDHPLETLAIYESENIQKVYWLDGVNQPRLINIVDTEEKQRLWNKQAEDQWKTTYFDFVPVIVHTLPTGKTVGTETTITKNKLSGGLFAPGVIQYCYSYVNKYGQQSNIAYVSDLFYITHGDRGASAEEKVNASFHIEINNPDTSFDYIRIYSIQRTSIDAEAYVKLLGDIKTTGEMDNSGVNKVVFTDTGTVGSSMDPRELFFIGGKEITALTMSVKDNTLFLGNISNMANGLDEQGKLQQYFMDKLRANNFEGLNQNEAIIKFMYGEDTSNPAKPFMLEQTRGIYNNTFTLNQSKRKITTFKGGEYYRLGLQFQTPTGEWTDPIYVGDYQNTLYPCPGNEDNSKTYLVVAKGMFNFRDIFFDMGNGDPKYRIQSFVHKFKKVRPVIVYPGISDRSVICQGVLNPTVFNALDRKSNSPYAQASWYFRPFMVNEQQSASSSGESEISIVNPGVTVTYTAITDPNSHYAERPGFIVGTDTSYSTSDHVGLYEDSFWAIGITCDDTTIKNILKRGGLEVAHYDSWDKVIYTVEKFWGVIKVDTNRYLIFRKEEWPNGRVEGAMWTYTGTVYRDALGGAIVGSAFNEFANAQMRSFFWYAPTQISLYRHLKRTSNYMLYYEATPDTVFTYTTYIYGYNTQQNHNFKITINMVSQGDDTGSEGISALPGTALQYKHFESLYTQEDFHDSGENIEDGRRIEIQGSKKQFSSVVDTTDENTTSNTQFFVDQSIVTLNSPDLEFDTDVQNYDFSDSSLKLRIVGYIPITAGASYHNIVAGEKLELNHNSLSYATTDTEEAKELEDKFNIKDGLVSFGIGELAKNILHNNNISVTNDNDAGNHLLAEYLWNDAFVKESTNEDYADHITTESYSCNYLVHPWHRSGSLCNDFRGATEAGSKLITKKESNILYSFNTEYFNQSYDFNTISTQIHLRENDYLENLRLEAQSSSLNDINYYPNIDKALYNSVGFLPILSEQSMISASRRVSDTVLMRYKSNTHAAISLRGEDSIPLLPSVEMNDSSTVRGTYSDKGVNLRTFWGSSMRFSQDTVHTHYKRSGLWVGELYRDISQGTAFGGTSESAIRNNKWVVCGDEVDITWKEDTGRIWPKDNVIVTWEGGDTFYQRYDCLKTYPFTHEDPNQIVEILSFMCESRVNLDGRWDKNRGQIDNTNTSPENFNLMNTVYNQQDNFFTYRRTFEENAAVDFSNQVYFTGTKTSGEDVDKWTNVTLASMLELDGVRGGINKLEKFNDQLLAFQDRGIAQILYNEKVQISPTEGVPIEIANSGKIQGYRYLSDTVGCQNKWSMVTTPQGIYFMDSNEKSIYLFNGQLNNISDKGGMNSWCKQHIPSPEIQWEPQSFGVELLGDTGSFVSYYDRKNQDVLFINKDEALVWNEKMGTFTSFYDYGGAPYFIGFKDMELWLNVDTAEGKDSNDNNDVYWSTKLWKHQEGDYCNFFGKDKGYSMTLIGNPAPQADKIFTNLDFRACVEGDGRYIVDAFDSAFDDSFHPKRIQFIPFLPFDSLEVWDEYQHGITELKHRDGRMTMKHHTQDSISHLARKFRMWRCDIPRDNASLELDKELGITRFKTHPNDRIRNPWVYLKLSKQEPLDDGTFHKAEIHDLLMTYYD